MTASPQLRSPARAPSPDRWARETTTCTPSTHYSGASSSATAPRGRRCRWRWPTPPATTTELLIYAGPVGQVTYDRNFGGLEGDAKFLGYGANYPNGSSPYFHSPPTGGGSCVRDAEAVAV